MLFTFIIIALLSNIVLADMGVGILLFMFPLLTIIATVFSISDNLLISYIAIRFVCKNQIKDKSHFFTFILKHTIIVGIVELVLLFITFGLNNYLLSSVIFSILSGVTIFFVFKHFIPKDLKMEEKKTNISSLFMGVLTNPGILLLAFYILSLIITLP